MYVEKVWRNDGWADHHKQEDETKPINTGPGASDSQTLLILSPESGCLQPLGRKVRTPHDVWPNRFLGSRCYGVKTGAIGEVWISGPSCQAVTYWSTRDRSRIIGFMAVRAAKKKDPAAVALGRKGGKKGGPARAAKLTPKQRSESARKAVQARWTKAKEGEVKKAKMETAPIASSTMDTSDNAVLALLKRIKATNNQNEIRQLSDQLERVIFHKQYANA